MLQEFRDHLTQNFPMLAGKRLLLAVSGGLDSMVMANLFVTLGHEIAIAHCNFTLRGAESDEDAEFVAAYAQKSDIRFFSARFDTAAFADDYKLSVQQAARKLRYEWFYELLEKEHYDFILTAHHLDDNFETFLINMLRGTGIDGLTGIPVQNDKIIRPMLAFTRKQISEFADSEQLSWREDSSNASDKYLRNKIRQQVVPMISTLSENFAETFAQTQQHLQQTRSMAEDASRLIYRKVIIEKENRTIIQLAELLRLPNYDAYLYSWLHPFGFRAWQDIYALPYSTSGKYILSPNFRLLKDREILILTPIEETAADNFEIDGTGIQTAGFKLSLEVVHSTGASSNNIIFVDAAKLSFPLTLRRKREGDIFKPIGMNGHSKKVSKFFKDQKMSVADKENTWLLCSGDKIVWILGSRQDERFKVDSDTRQIIRITIE